MVTPQQTVATGIAARLLGNSAWNATAFVVSAGINILTIPYVVHRLGVASFGMAGLVAACVAPALIFSNSLSLSIARELAQRLNLDRRLNARAFLSAALLAAITIGALVALTVAFAGPWLARTVFNLDDLVASDIQATFLFAAVGWFCQCVSSVQMSLFTARQDYAHISTLNMLGAVVTAASVIIGVPARPLASTYFACQALGAFTILVGAFALTRIRLEGWVARPGFHRRELDQLARFGIWQMVAQGGGVIGGQAERYILGIVLPSQFVGLYVIAQRLEEAVYIGILKIGEILFPFFSVMQDVSKARQIDLLFRACWILNIVAACSLGAIMPTAGPLLLMWTGPDVAADAERVLVTLAIAGILGSSVNALAFYLLATGASRLNAVIATVTGGTALIISVVCLPYFGWVAAGWGVCGSMVAQIIVTTILLKRVTSVAAFWSRFIVLVATPLLVGIGGGLSLRHLRTTFSFAQAQGWWSVGLCYFLSATVILLICLASSQVGPYRATCRRDLAAIVGRVLRIGKF